MSTKTRPTTRQCIGFDACKLVPMLGHQMCPRCYEAYGGYRTYHPKDQKNAPNS